MSQLWEILVPCNWNNEAPVRTRHHREWDRRVRAITGGLTVLKPGVGQWVSPDGDLYRDRVIPVRLMATAEQMVIIGDMTIAHYEQLAVMYYMVSEQCVVQYCTEEQKERFTHV